MKLCHLSCPAGLGLTEVRWCTVSNAEQQKCADMGKAFQGAGIQPLLLCVDGTSADHCVQLIKVTPLPPACPPPWPRQEGPDSEGAHNSPIHWERGHCPLCQGWAMQSAEFPEQQEPNLFLAGGRGRGCRHQWGKQEVERILL